MEPSDQDKIRVATATLEAINQQIKKGDFMNILTTINGCPYPRQLAQSAFDKEGQGIFFKLVRIPNQDQTLRLISKFQNEGGQLHRRDCNKQTVLYYAVRWEKVKLVDFLLKEELAVDQNDYVLQTPLFYAAKYNQRTEIVDLLLQANCDPNHKDANGQTCLFYAAAEGRLQTCKLLAQNGANILSTDKNKERPIHYARRGNHRQVIQFLTSFGRKEVRKVQEMREERRMQESSQNTVDRRRKKQNSRTQCVLAFTNQDGQTRILTQEELLMFKDACESNAKLYSVMCSNQQSLQGVTPLPDRRFQKLALKILNHFNKHENGSLFNEPVNYQAHGMFDYPSIVKYPMDFGTIKRKLNLNCYENEADFQGDMNLVFDNCILYHSTEKDLGKIALQMKTQFNAMFFKEFA